MNEDGLGILTSILTNHSSDVTVIYSQSLATLNLKQNQKTDPSNPGTSRFLEGSLPAQIG